MTDLNRNEAQNTKKDCLKKIPEIFVKNIENWRSWKSHFFSVGNFYFLCFIPIKISHNLWGSKDGTIFWWLLTLISCKKLEGYKVRNTVPESDYDNCKLKFAEWQCRWNKTKIQISRQNIHFYVSRYSKVPNQIFM